MSLENLLLLAFFVLLPLIQQLLEWQKRPPQPPAESPANAPPQPRPQVQPPPVPQTADTSVPVPSRPPRPLLQPPPAHLPTPAPAPVPPAPSGSPSAAVARPSMPVRTLARERTPGRAARSAVTAARQSQQGNAVKELRDPMGLRRSVVQMTILGPCRATSPYGWPAQ